MTEKLNIKQYWIRIALTFAELLIVSVVLLALAGAISSEELASRQVIATILVGLMILNGIANVVYMLITILRRARDAGYTIPLFLIGAFIPFGFVVTGVIPTKK